MTSNPSPPENPAVSDPLVFMMGKFEARIPTDRLYSRHHLWLKVTEGKSEIGPVYRVGFTAYSLRLLQDIYFLDWSVDADSPVEHRQTLGEVESSKALSSLHAPGAGQLLRFNETVLSDPATINADNYGAGWLYELASGAEWLDPSAYITHLEAGWERDQQYLKGQVNR